MSSQHPGLRPLRFLDHAEGHQSPIRWSQPAAHGSLKGYPGGKTWLFSINFSFQEWLQGKEGDIGQRLWGLISNSVHLSFFFSSLFFFSFQIQKQRVFPLYFSFTPRTSSALVSKLLLFPSRAPDTCRVTNPSLHTLRLQQLHLFPPPPKKNGSPALHTCSTPLWSLPHTLLLLQTPKFFSAES